MAGVPLIDHHISQLCQVSIYYFISFVQCKPLSVILAHVCFRFSSRVCPQSIWSAFIRRINSKNSSRIAIENITFPFAIFKKKSPKERRAVIFRWILPRLLYLKIMCLRFAEIQKWFARRTSDRNFRAQRGHLWRFANLWDGRWIESSRPKSSLFDFDDRSHSRSIHKFWKCKSIFLSLLRLCNTLVKTIIGASYQ